MVAVFESKTLGDDDVRNRISTHFVAGMADGTDGWSG